MKDVRRDTWLFGLIGVFMYLTPALGMDPEHAKHLIGIITSGLPPLLL